jgi:hypothetical protein
MCLAGGLLGFGFLWAQAQLVKGYGTEGTYPAYSLKEMIQFSSAIFEGKVISISQAQFNQDNGDYWEPTTSEALVYPYHLIEIEVTRSLKDEIGIGQQVTITQVGASPSGNRPGLRVGVKGASEHSLQVGQQAVFFVVQMDFPWREGGKRSAIHLVGYPEHAYLKQQSNGLWHFAGGDSDGPISFDNLIKAISNN